ncbi:MAG TPA: TA system VapC family ribonuclease toxin [Streptosporangiaceae bacterium]|nr:TA system VapC family ribonuclease toxin [Streptosporangiaceae bacterium]
MIAVDTNILVYAHRRDSPFHAAAAARIRELAEGRAPWALPWPCVHEFYSVVTHARIYRPPSTGAEAVGQIGAWLEAPSVVLVSEGPAYWAVLARLLAEGKVAGPSVHDARIAALCLVNGVSELWSADRDFSRFPDLRTANPLV